MYKAILLSKAKEDIKYAALYYNDKQKGLGKRFTLQVRKTLGMLELFPEIYPIKYNDVRVAVLETFPYMLHYKTNNVLKQIIVIAVLHTSRNPEVWKKRNDKR